VRWVFDDVDGDGSGALLGPVLPFDVLDVSVVRRAQGARALRVPGSAGDDVGGWGVV